MEIKRLIATLLASASLIIGIVALAGLLFRYQNALAALCNWLFYSNYSVLLGAFLFAVALVFKMSYEDDCRCINKTSAPKVQPMAPVVDPATTSHIPAHPYADVQRRNANAKTN